MGWCFKLVAILRKTELEDGKNFNSTSACRQPDVNKISFFFCSGCYLALDLPGLALSFSNVKDGRDN